MTRETPAMSASPDQRAGVLAFYDGASKWLRPAVEQVTKDADARIAVARERFEDLIDELPYVDRPTHTMASSMFACATALALYQVLRAEGVDAHAWGRAIHALPAVVGPEDEAAREAEGLRAAEEARTSQASARANEFVFELLGPDESSERGMNITSCAICHLFGRHDAMALVPYMCALDDVMSDARGQGLRRTGTIALGAKQCDFRFQPGDPLALVEQYPDRIRLRDE